MKVLNKKYILGSMAAMMITACGAESSSDIIRVPTAAELSCNMYIATNCLGVNWSTVKEDQIKTINTKLVDNNGRTALHWAAAKSSDPMVIKALLDANADVHAVDKMGYTALHAAVEGSKSYELVIRELLTAGASVNSNASDQDSPLHAASRINELWVIKLLLEEGANPKAGDFDNMTPLHTAAFDNTDVEVLQALIDAGADVNAAGKTTGRAQQAGYTPLHAAAKGSRTPEVIAILLAAGAKIESPNRDGFTPLHVAADANRTPAVIDAFIKAGAKVNASNKDGNTPLHLAAFTNYPKMLEALIKAGAKVNAKTEDGLTPLHYAATNNGDPAVLTTLIRAGADVKLKDQSNSTAFDYAQKNIELKGTDGDGYRLLKELTEN